MEHLVEWELARETEVLYSVHYKSHDLTWDQTCEKLETNRLSYGCKQKPYSLFEIPVSLYTYLPLVYPSNEILQQFLHSD